MVMRENIDLPIKLGTDLILSAVNEQTFVTTSTKDTVNVDQTSYCTYRIDENIGRLTDVHYRLPDSPIEIPITKRMIFKFGKPQKKEFVFIED